MNHKEFTDYYNRVTRVCSEVASNLYKTQKVETGYVELDFDEDNVWASFSLFYPRCCGDDSDSFEVDLTLFDKHKSDVDVVQLLTNLIYWKRQQAKIDQANKDKEEQNRINEERRLKQEENDKKEFERLKVKYGNVRV